MLLVTAMGFGAAARGQDQTAFARAAHLKRGINLSMWYAQSHDQTAERLASYITPADFKLVHDLGFDHVRVSIDPEPLIEERQSGRLRKEAMARLDGTVQGLTSLGLVVVLDIHPEPNWVKDSITTDDGAMRFLNFWRNFAQHFAGTNPDLVYFEVLNEPNGVDNYRWEGEQARAIAVIRSQAPRHTIIATAAQWGGIQAMLATEPVRDDNVIYTFHDYDPMTFTHQGASWVSPNYISLHGVPYPSSPEAVAPLLGEVPDEMAQVQLKRYGLERWNGARLAAEIGLAAEWARRRHVPLWCGEFGVYRAYAPPAARAAWLSDMRHALEANGIGWTMWDYQGGFALVTKKDGVATPDPAILDALGLARR
jgi:endoglucanase